MKGTGRSQFSRAFVVGMALILGSFAAPMPIAAAQGTSIASATVPGSLPDMLGHLPNLPLVLSNATITYTNLAAQAAATGVLPTSATSPDDEQRAWVAVMLTIYLPSTAPYWLRDEWVEAVGFNVYQIEQSIEYFAPPRRVMVLRDSFEATVMREIWGQAGYQPIDLESGDACAIRDDFAFDRDEPISRMVLSAMNVLALADDGSLIAGTDRASVASALAAASGASPSMITRPDVAPLVETAPGELASGILLPGTIVQYVPDVASVVLESGAPESMATRVEEDQDEAQRMPPIGPVLLGVTAGHLPDTPGKTPAQAVVAISVGSAANAEQGATIVRERLETESVPSTVRTGVMGRPWAELFPQRTVAAVADQGVALVTLTPAADVRLLSLPLLAFSRALTFMAW